jgi:hypothetical protein
MFETARDRAVAIERYRRTRPDVAEAIEQEFFWLIEDSVAELERLDFVVSTKRFSDLSWGILATVS